MIKHAWTVICQRSITDKETNNISLDILEQLSIQTSSLPTEAKGVVFPVQMEIISLWYRAQTEHGIKGNGRLKILAPNDEEIGSVGIEIDLTSNNRARTRARLNGLLIPKDVNGYFYFVTELESNKNWVEVSRIPLEVSLEYTHS